MAARLQRDISGRALSVFGMLERRDFGMIVAGLDVPAFADDVVIANQYAADARIRMRGIEAVAGQLQRPGL